MPLASDSHASPGVAAQCALAEAEPILQQVFCISRVVSMHGPEGWTRIDLRSEKDRVLKGRWRVLWVDAFVMMCTQSTCCNLNGLLENISSNRNAAAPAAAPNSAADCATDPFLRRRASSWTLGGPGVISGKSKFPWMFRCFQPSNVLKGRSGVRHLLPQHF